MTFAQVPCLIVGQQVFALGERQRMNNLVEFFMMFGSQEAERLKEAMRWANPSLWSSAHSEPPWTQRRLDLWQSNVKRQALKSFLTPAATRGLRPRPVANSATNWSEHSCFGRSWRGRLDALGHSVPLFPLRHQGGARHLEPFCGLKCHLQFKVLCFNRAPLGSSPSRRSLCVQPSSENP